MRRITMVLMVAVVMLVAVAGPAMAQDDKAAKKAARQAERAAKKAQDPTPAQKATPAANDASKKALPATGGPVANLALLGGSLIVGGGIVAIRISRR